MKINKIIIAFTIAATLLSTSCSDFLDQGPESHMPEDVIFTDVNGVNAYVQGLYSSWRTGHVGRVDHSLGTDEVIAGGIQYSDNSNRKGLDGYGQQLNSTNGAIRTLWTHRYEVISRSAPAISALKKMENQNNEQFNILLGEACFLRAQNMWELSMWFGAVPVYDTDKPEYGSVRQPLNVVLANIEADLLIAEKYLPDPSKVEDDGHVSKALAQAYLGKLYLYASEQSGYRDYVKAAEYFKKVVDNPYFGGTGAPNYAVIFDSYSNTSGDYKKEMVYAFQYRAGWPNQNGAEWELGSRAVAQMTKVEAIAPWSGFDGMLPSEYAYKMVSEGGVWEAGDVRRDESVRFNFEWNGIVPNLAGYGWGDELEPHIKKYEDLRIVEKGQSTWHSGKNLPLIRYSDVVLNYAECLYMTGHQGEAITLINNVVRKRAFGGTLPADKVWDTAMSKDEFMTKLMDERLRELCFEGWRKFDLLRTGLLKEYVAKRNRWHIGGTITNVEGTVLDTKESPRQIEDYKLLWPIPLDELQQNPEMTLSDQNPGYSN